MASAKDKAAEKQARDRFTGVQVLGISILSIGLGLNTAWVGIAAFGLGVLAIGVALEVDGA